MSEIEYCDGEIRWVSPGDLIDINNLAISVFTPAEPKGFDKAKLEGAQARPAQYRYYHRTNDMATLAAVLLDAVIKAHAFVNGNKRTAFMSTVMFMRMNGYEFMPPEREVLIVCEDCAKGLFEVGQIAHWIASHSAPSDSAELVSDLLHVVFDYKKSK